MRFGQCTDLYNSSDLDVFCGVDVLMFHFLQRLNLLSAVLRVILFHLGILDCLLGLTVVVESNEPLIDKASCSRDISDPFKRHVRVCDVLLQLLENGIWDLVCIVAFHTF